MLQIVAWLEPLMRQKYSMTGVELVETHSCAVMSACGISTPLRSTSLRQNVPVGATAAE